MKRAPTPDTIKDQPSCEQHLVEAPLATVQG